MSDNSSTITGTSTAAGDAPAARAAADLAAERAGVRITLLRNRSETSELVHLLARIWGVSDDHGPIDPSIVAAMMHGNGYVSGAYAGSELVAGSIGFITGDAFDTLHSHVTGVLGGRGRSGVGTAIKLHQRSWAIEHRLTSITWTYDPLIARNARFNLQRLGARLEDYLVDFYGPMHDDRNRGQPSDRAFTRWDLTGPTTPPDVSTATTAQPVLSGVHDGPVIDDRALAAALRGADSPVELVIPADIEAIRAGDPDLAMAWRLALRETLRPLLQVGWQLAGFLPDRSSGHRPDTTTAGRYRLVRPAEPDKD